MSTDGEKTVIASSSEMTLGYKLGQRDMLAVVLVETYKKTKLPEQAEFYEKHYGEHFTLGWHKS